MTGQWWNVKQPCGCQYEELRMKGKLATYAVARHYSRRCKSHPKPQERAT